jgi:branched-chain amino acid transport system substrate-binding protein
MRLTLLTIPAMLAVFASGHAANGAEPKSIRIGYAISKTGAYADGATMTVLPNYQLWVKEINDAGGIMLSSVGRRVPIEVIEYDDQSSDVEAYRVVEQLATKDKVDIILPPWGTHLNLTVAPLFNRYGYPQLPGTSGPPQGTAEPKEPWPYTFFSLGRTADQANGIIDVLTTLRRQGKIGNDVAIMQLAESMGTYLGAAAHATLKREKFNLVYDRTYPLGARDIQAMLKSAMERKPDAFIAFSYPTDTIAITEQAIELNFNPKVFYVGVGAAYPTYKQRFGANVDGVMGIGGTNVNSPKLQAYFRRHLEVTGREADRWASSVTYALLQILQQAIEEVGKIDREAMVERIRTQTFDTILGPVKFEGNMLNRAWAVGQWQTGEFHGVGPATMPGAQPVLFPKPAWRTPE